MVSLFKPLTVASMQSHLQLGATSGVLWGTTTSPVSGGASECTECCKMPQCTECCTRGTAPERHLARGSQETKKLFEVGPNKLHYTELSLN